MAKKPDKILAPYKANGKSKSPKDQGVQDVAQSVTEPIDGTIVKFDKALPKAKTLIADGLQQLTAIVAMRDLQPIQLRDVFDYSAGLEDAIKEAKGFARTRILDLALRTGEATGSTGDSRKLTYPDGRYTLAKATKTGTDPKKFEAALRAKGIEVTKYMVTELKYKMPSDYDALKQAIDDKVLTADEAATMGHEPSYAVERSKEGKE